MDGSMMSAIAIVVIGFAAYFAPAIIASVRGRDGTAMIAFLNLLLGWTVIGWVVLLVIAFTGRTQRDRDQQDEQLRLMRTLVAQQSLSAESAGQPLAVAPTPATPPPPPASAPAPEPPQPEDTRTLAEIMAEKQQ